MHAHLHAFSLHQPLLWPPPAASRLGGACGGWRWAGAKPPPRPLLLAGLKLQGPGKGVLGEKGLSVGVHIWEPLAHSCPLSACLRMDLDGTGREGRGGRFAPADGNPDGSRRLPGPRAGRGLGGAACSFPSAGPQDEESRRPDPRALPRLGDTRHPSSRPGSASGGSCTKPGGPRWPPGPVCKAGAPGSVGLRVRPGSPGSSFPVALPFPVGTLRGTCGHGSAREHWGEVP